MKYVIINAEPNSFDIDEIKTTIERLFTNNENYIVTLNIFSKEIYFTVEDSIKKKFVTYISVPYNIKNKNKLGYYDEDLDYMIMSHVNRSFRMRRGYGTNKPIRPLYSIYKKKF